MAIPPPPDKPADFTASDILSADAWTATRLPKPVLGLDVACTRIDKPMPFFTSLNGPPP